MAEGVSLFVGAERMCYNKERFGKRYGTRGTSTT